MSEVLQSRIIVPIDIRVENRKGYEILVVEDGNRNQYTTADDYLRNHVTKHEDKYLESEWKIAFNRTEEGYLDFFGFLTPIVGDREERDERIDELEERLEKLEEVISNYD